MPESTADSVTSKTRDRSPSPSISNSEGEVGERRSLTVEDDDDVDAVVSVSDVDVDADVKSGKDQSETSRRDVDEETQDARSDSDKSERSNASGDILPPPKLHRGLVLEDPLPYLPFGDLVFVHGMCASAWYMEALPDSGCRPSTTWLFQHAGFSGYQYLPFFFPHGSTEFEKPPIFYHDGIEHEALLLLDGLVAYREELKTRFSDDSVNQRPIAFVAHDVGGFIVKKALSIAALNPAKYGDIAYCTTCIVFLGCPHRAVKVDLQDTLTKLFWMPGNKWQSGTPKWIEILAEAAQYTNGEFYDTNALLRASIFNIYYEGVTTWINNEEVVVQSPFPGDMVILDTPWEFFKPVTVPHNDLVEGGHLYEGNSSDHFAHTIRDEMYEFPTAVASFWGNENLHKLFLAMAPPCLPAQPYQFSWQPYIIENWFVEHGTYKEWLTGPGIGVLHAHGDSHMATKSQVLYSQLQGREHVPNMMYFEFRRHDSRFNSLEAMLKTFIAHIMTRVPQRNGTRDDYSAMMPLIFHYQAMSLTDLMHIFRTMLMWRHIPPLVFMIACFDECDRNKYRLLGLIYSLREFTEMRHRFIITSLAEERLMSRLAGNYSINLEDFNDVNDRPAWTDTFEKTYEIQLNLLTDGRPVFRSFMPHIREILASCGTDYRLGHLIIRWLLNKKTNPGRDTKAYAESVLDSLEPVTAENVLSTILHAFGPDVDRARIYLDWVTVAARPLTLIELGTAVDFTEDPTSDALNFVDFQNIRSEVERFGLVFAITDNVVDLWLPYYQERTHYDEADVERAHGRIAAACLEYLLLDVTQTLSWEFYGRFPDPEGVVPFSPKDSLLSYAVQFWTQHYSKAGEKKPFGKAQEFFQHVEARNTWWAMLQLLNPPILRVYWSFLSPLPMVASTGLDDLLEAQLKIESDSSTLKKDAGIALIQAARNGHKSAMALVKDHAEITKELLTDLINEAAGEESPECVEEVARLASSSSLVIEATPIDICRTVWVGWKEIAENLYNSAKEQERELDFRSELHPLHLAVEHGDEALVEMVIDWIDDINTRDKWGRTALHLAATVGDPGVIRLLLAKGADIEAEFEVEDRGSLTSLQLATASGNHLALDVLLQNDAKVNVGANELIGGIGSFHEAPPIIYAAGMGFIKCVEVLLQHKADLTVTVSNCSALWYAVEGGRVDIARLLLEAGAKPTDNPDKLEMLLFLPIRTQNMEMLDLLLDHDADVNGESSWDTMSRTPLARAAAGGDLEIVKKLLDKGAKPDLVGTDSQSPLYLAAYEEHPEVAYLLLEKEVDVNKAVEATKWTPLHAAYDNKELVERLLKEGANIDALSDSGTVLYLAAKHNEWEVVELLIEKKANLEIATQRISDDLPKEEFDMTPLCVACLKGNSGVVRSLLLAGANANHVCKDEDTGDDLTFPLRICLDEYWDGVVDVILEPRPGIGTRPDLKLSANGNTVLHSIRTSTSLPAVKSLIGSGADIEASNKAGATALIVALDCNNFDVAEYLIAQGANVNHYSADHGTPLHVTCRTADAVLFKALISRDADVKRADSSGYHSTLLGVLASTGEDWDKMQDIAKYLLEEAQVDPNAKCRKQPWYPLCRAAWEPTDELVTYLIEKGADVNVEDAWGLKPLHFASWYSWDMHNIIRNAEGLKDPWPLNKVKMSPLHYSANGRIWNDGFDELLTKVGASVDDKDADGWDAVMWSAKANYDEPEVIEAIVKRARDDALWDKGYVTSERLWSPLKCATYYGSMERVYNVLTPPEDKRTRKLKSGEEEVWDDDAHKSREADFKDTRCNLCLGRIYGFAYRCTSCDVFLCYKCNRSRDILCPGHDYEEIGPEFSTEGQQPGDEGDDVITSEGGKVGTSVISGSESKADVDLEGLSSSDEADDEGGFSDPEVDPDV